MLCIKIFLARLSAMRSLSADLALIRGFLFPRGNPPAPEGIHMEVVPTAAKEAERHSAFAHRDRLGNPSPIAAALVVLIGVTERPLMASPNHHHLFPARLGAVPVVRGVALHRNKVLDQTLHGLGHCRGIFFGMI